MRGKFPFSRADPSASSVSNTPLNGIDPYGLFDWDEFKGGVKDAAVGLAVGVGVGIVVVAVLPEAAVAGAVVGAFYLGWETGQAITGQKITIGRNGISTHKMCDAERSRLLGEVAVGWVAMGSLAKGAKGEKLNKSSSSTGEAQISFSTDEAQIGKKLGKHVQDFGGNPANPADRARVIDIINDIGSNPDKIVPGTFRGQGPGGTRGPVDFRIKGNDVVVTKKDGTFITILKDGVNNSSVKEALK